MPECCGRLPWPSRHDPSARTGGFFHSCTKKKATREGGLLERYGSRLPLPTAAYGIAAVLPAANNSPPGCCIQIGSTLSVSCSKKESHPEGWPFGAGYGSRTRLHGLGSRCITDIRILQLSVIIAEPKGKFNRFLSVRQSTSRGGNCCIWDFFMIGYMYQTNRRFFHETQQPSSRSHHLL